MLPMIHSIEFSNQLTSGLLLHNYEYLWKWNWMNRKYWKHWIRIGMNRNGVTNDHVGCEYGKLLGNDQWTWLENELLLQNEERKEEELAVGLQPPELYIILSSIQVWTTNPVAVRIYVSQKKKTSHSIIRGVYLFCIVFLLPSFEDLRFSFIKK